MPRRLLDDCFLHDKDRLKHAEVLAILRERLSGVTDPQDVALDAASGRIAAADIVATLALPPRDNAAVDGYTFSHDSYVATGGVMPVALRLPAGTAPTEALAPGTAARVFTGAQMPDGAETVAMQEDCTESDGTVTIPRGLKAGANCRKAGEDVAPGDLILSAGQRITPSDVAALAGQGITSLKCFALPRVTLFSTGDELVEPGQELAPGQIHDTNRAMLKAMLAGWPCTVTDGGHLPDDASAVRRAIARAARSSDVILTSGGASRGEEDHIVDVLSGLGTRHLWQIAIKPGRPLVMGQIPGQEGDTVAIGLPGNPVAAFVCALLYLHPALHVLGGADWPEPAALMLPAQFEVPRKKPDRREFYRAFPVMEDGIIVGVQKFDRDGSGLISGLQAAKGLIEVPEEVTSIARGDLVRYLPLSGFDL